MAKTKRACELYDEIQAWRAKRKVNREEEKTGPEKHEEQAPKTASKSNTQNGPNSLPSVSKTDPQQYGRLSTTANSKSDLDIAGVPKESVSKKDGNEEKKAKAAVDALLRDKVDIDLNVRKEESARATTSAATRETRSSPLQRQTARPGPTTPGERTNETQKPPQQHARKTQVFDFLTCARSLPEKPPPLLESPFRVERGTRESGVAYALEPRRRATYGFDVSPTRQAARKSAASVAVDLSASRNRSRVSKGQDTTPKRGHRNSSLRMTDALVRDTDDDSTPPRRANKKTGIPQPLSRVSVKDSGLNADEIRRKEAAHKDEPQVQFAWPAGQPPPKLFAPQSVLRALGEAGISARQKHKVDESFDPKTRPWTHRFERKINKTDGSTAFGNRSPDKDVDDRLIALPKTPQKSGTTRSAPGTLRGDQRYTPEHARSLEAGYRTLDDLDRLFDEDGEYVYGPGGLPKTSTGADRERSPTHQPQKNWRQGGLSQNVEKAKKDPYEGLK